MQHSDSRHINKSSPGLILPIIDVPDVLDAPSSAKCTICASLRQMYHRSLCLICPFGPDVLLRQTRRRLMVWCLTRARCSSSSRCPNGSNVPMDKMSQRTRLPNGPDVLSDKIPQRARCPFGPDAPAGQMSFRTRCPNRLNHIHGKMNIYSAQNTDRFT